MRNFCGFVLIGSFLVISGCQQSDKIAELEKRQKASEDEIAVLKVEVDAMKRDASIDKMFRDIDQFAYLTPGSDGYSVIKFNLGYLTVQIADIKEYANGSKVRLKFGNPLASNINGLTGTIEWGPVDKKGSPQNDRAKSKTFSFSTSLRSGSWNNVDIVLEGVPPTDLGFVRLKGLSHSGIVLQK